MDNRRLPELRVTVFSDYICPFCYIGDVRLARLREDYDLKVNWCSIEIHPETPPLGRPVSELNYSPQQWQAMMDGLARMAAQEGLHFAPHETTTNSHRALLLAEAAKSEGATVFYALHGALFKGYFSDGLNIGDEAVLRRMAEESGMRAETVESAWHDTRYADRLEHNLAAARELGVSATPTFFIGQQKLTGAVTVDELQKAAAAALSGSTA